MLDGRCDTLHNDFRGDDLSWEDIAKALWEILDDIDTLPDMLHPSEDAMADKCWRMMVKRAGKRHQYLFSDGYKLTKYKPPKSQPTNVNHKD